MFALSCSPPAVIEGPPSLSASLTVNQETILVGKVLRDLIQQPSGAAAVRRSILLQILQRRSSQLGKATSPNNVSEWREKLAHLDQEDASLYAWAAQIIELRSTDENSLRERFETDYPNGFELIGKQINLSPQVAWTEDHYQRHLGALRSAARLKLSQWRHQLIEGRSFKEVARAKSHHKLSRERDGLISLDELRAEGRPPKIIRAARELRPGELSQILQDDTGMYLFTNEAEPSPLTLDAEGIFIPKASWSSQLLNSDQLWTLIEAVCDQSLKCSLPDLLSRSKTAQQWRQVFEDRLSRQSKAARRDAKRRARRRQRLSDKAKGDTRTLSGREKSWASISPRLLEEVNAEYHAQVDASVIKSLRSTSNIHYIERAPLFKTLPLQFTPKGVWLMRLRGRTLLPALARPRLRMIYLDLTRSGLKSHWGSWGVEKIGRLLIDAARQHRLDEALSTLGIQSAPITPRSIKSSHIKDLLSVSLDSGSRLIQSRSGSDWILIKLDQRVAVKFEDKMHHIATKLQEEMINPIAIRRSLNTLWKSIEVNLHIDGEELDLSVADEVGFTRPLESTESEL